MPSSPKLRDPSVVIGVSNTPPPPERSGLAEEAQEQQEKQEKESVTALANVAAAEVLPSAPGDVSVAAESAREADQATQERESESESDEPPPASEKRIAAVRPAREERFGEDTLIDARPPCEPEPETKIDEPTISVKNEADKPLATTAIMGGAAFDPNAPVSKSTLIMGSSTDEPKTESAETRSSREALSNDTLPGLGKSEPEQKEEREEREEKVTVAKQEISVEPTPTPSGVVLPIEDEISVPPIVNDPSLERFFSEGDLGRHVVDEEPEPLPEKIKRKAAPHVVERRARFVRYVTWAVGISAVVCLAAVARTALSPKAVPAEHAASAPVLPEPPPIIKEEPKPVAAAEPPKAEAKEAQPPGAAEPQTVAEAAPAPKAGEAPAAEAAAEPPVGDAKEEKKACKKALERGKLKEAIAAGERSIAIDPTDGEAWLLLGAAYQESGKLAEARRCYAACVKEGKTGPRNECAKMLR